MTITLTTTLEAAAQLAADKRNADNPGLSPWTKEDWCADALSVPLTAIAAADREAKRLLMAGVANTLIDAAGGDVAKLQRGIEAAQAAALAAIAA